MGNRLLGEKICFKFIQSNGRYFLDHPVTRFSYVFHYGPHSVTYFMYL